MIPDPATKPARKTTRRAFIRSAAAFSAGLWSARRSSGIELLVRSARKSDVRIERVSASYEEHVFRAPLKFALSVVNRQTMLTVECTVRTSAGKLETGFGTLPLNYVFTYPSRALSEEARLGAMKALAEE